MNALYEINQLIPNFDPSKYHNLDDEWRRLIGYNNYYRWLWAAVTYLKPKYVVEIGRERGVSATIMLDAMPADGRLISIDIVEEAKFLDYDFQDSRLTRLTANSIMAAYMIPSNIEFLFIDGEHTKEHVEQEWQLYKPLLAEHAVVAFDDIHFNSGMTEFWNNLDEPHKYDISEWHEPGFGVVFL